MDKIKVEKLAALYEKLETVNRTLSLKSPSWTFSVGATHKDGNQFECVDVPTVLAKGVLDAVQMHLEGEIKKLGGAV